MKHCYALFSGGFDSTLATLKAIREDSSIRLTPVFFEYGQKSVLRYLWNLLPLNEHRHDDVHVVVDAGWA